MTNGTYLPTVVPGTTVVGLTVDGAGLITHGVCTGVPPTTANTFQVGCRMIQSDSAASTNPNWSNLGSAAVPSWTRGAAVNSTAVGVNDMNVAHAIYNFAVDGGAVGAITPVSTVTIPANAIIVAATINSPTAVTSAGAATVSIGTTAGSSATSLLAATAKTSFTTDALLNGVTTFAAPIKMTASGSVNINVGTAALTAGLIEIFVFYTVATNA